jgi:hypothetical protein
MGKKTYYTKPGADGFSEVINRNKAKKLQTTEDKQEQQQVEQLESNINDDLVMVSSPNNLLDNSTEDTGSFLVGDVKITACTMS